MSEKEEAKADRATGVSERGAADIRAEIAGKRGEVTRDIIISRRAINTLKAKDYTARSIAATRARRVELFLIAIEEGECSGMAAERERSENLEFHLAEEVSHRRELQARLKSAMERIAELEAKLQDPAHG